MTAYTRDVRKGPATAVTLDMGVNVIDIWVENGVSDAYNRIKMIYSIRKQTRLWRLHRCL